MLNGEIELFGVRGEVEEATAPTNIVFENKDTPMHHRMVKMVGIAVVILMLFAGIILFTLFMKKDGERLIEEYKEKTDCSKTGLGFSVKQWVEGSVHEFQQKIDSPNGVLACFCKR